MSRFGLILGLGVVFSFASTVRADTQMYHAVLSSDAVIAGGASASTSAGSGTATFVLNYDPAMPSSATMSYDILLAADLDGTQTTDLNDDITAIHLHDVMMCMMPSCQAGDTAGTMHVLNIFGTPRHDDADMLYFPASGQITGLWDPSDENSLMPAPSGAPADSLHMLHNGNLFLMVHTREFPNGAFGGFLVPVPEPTSVSLVLLGCLGVVAFRRRPASVR